MTATIATAEIMSIAPTTTTTTTTNGSCRSEADKSLREFIESSQPPSKDWPRVKCCDSSRYLYCPICYRILIPKENWEQTVHNPPFYLRAAKEIGKHREEGENIHSPTKLEFPFQLDVLLHDRRTSSTGLQAVSVLRSMQKSNSSYLNQHGDLRGEKETTIINDNDISESISNNQHLFQAQVYDIKAGEVPSYDIHGEDQDGTYLLFPGPHSAPLSSVAAHVKKLVVLDCTWGHTGTRLLPTVAALPQVSLDANMLPLESYYWRWHNAGDGMLSTIEAVYFASWEITTHCGWTLEERQQLVYILWLFGMQRASIADRYANQQEQAPFTKEAKEKARKLRINESRGKAKTSSNHRNGG